MGQPQKEGDIPTLYKALGAEVQELLRKATAAGGERSEVEAAAWRQEVIGHEGLFIELHDHLPPEMVYERELLICRL